MSTTFCSGQASRITAVLAGTNVTVAAVGERQLHSILGYNAATAVRYLKFYDTATAPTVGTTVPVLTIALPPTTAFGLSFGGHAFKRGLAYALTTGDGDADTGALTANDILGLNVLYS